MNISLVFSCDLSNGVSMHRSFTRQSPGDGSASPPSSCAYVWQQIVIVVNKDEKGYGMKVSGDNPVYVQSVKSGKCSSAIDIFIQTMVHLHL